MVGRLSPPLGRLEQDVEARLDLSLADVLVQRARAQRPFHGDLAGVAGAGREEAEAVVGHRAESTSIDAISHRCSNAARVIRSVPSGSPCP